MTIEIFIVYFVVQEIAIWYVVNDDNPKIPSFCERFVAFIIYSLFCTLTILSIIAYDRYLFNY